MFDLSEDTRRLLFIGAVALAGAALVWFGWRRQLSTIRTEAKQEAADDIVNTAATLANAGNVDLARARDPLGGSDSPGYRGSPA